MIATATLLHTATTSHDRDPRGLLVARGLCTSCPWTGPKRDTAMAAFADARDHEDGIDVDA